MIFGFRCFLKQLPSTDIKNYTIFSIMNCNCIIASMENNYQFRTLLKDHHFRISNKTILESVSVHGHKCSVGCSLTATIRLKCSYTKKVHFLIIHTS